MAIMANTKKSAAMEMLEYLRRRHDQSIEDALASIERAQARLDNMGETLDRMDKILNGS